MKYYTIKETAELLGIPFETVRSKVRYNQVESIKEGFHHLLPQSSFDSIKEEALLRETHYTTTELAKLINFASRITLIDWCRTGKLDCVKKFTQWYVSEKGFQDLKKEQDFRDNHISLTQIIDKCKLDKDRTYGRCKSGTLPHIKKYGEIFFTLATANKIKDTVELRKDYQKPKLNLDDYITTVELASKFNVSKQAMYNCCTRLGANLLKKNKKTMYI